VLNTISLCNKFTCQLILGGRQGFSGNNTTGLRKRFITVSWHIVLPNLLLVINNPWIYYSSSLVEPRSTGASVNLAQLMGRKFVFLVIYDKYATEGKT
jgi:hypothetical protein